MCVCVMESADLKHITASLFVAARPRRGTLPIHWHNSVHDPFSFAYIRALNSVISISDLVSGLFFFLPSLSLSLNGSPILR